MHIADEVLGDLRARLRRTRWPGALDPGWTLGAAPAALRDLCAYWADGFDWRRIERDLNALDHYTETIEGRRLHFVLARSPAPGALPLVLLHGWPGSFLEFRGLLGPLTDPAAHGGAPEDAFDVVIPSLPGFGFSEAPADPAYDYRCVARAIGALMDALGFARFGAHGGDAGAAVAAWLGADRPERTAGIHLSTALVGRPPGGGDPMEGVTAEEAAALRAHREVFLAEQAAHLEIQGTRPQTLAYALEDSPVGLAAWFLDKVRMWSEAGDLAAFDREDLLANLTLYWATGTVASSMRYYHAVRHGTGRFFPDRRVEVPTGCAIFPREVYRPPRRWAEAWFDLRRWTAMPRGGHFPALEAPELLVEDLRAFFRPLRKGGGS